MKKRIVIFVDGQGRTTARMTRNFDFEAWECEKANLHIKGFRQVLGGFSVPRRIHSGWFRLYGAWLKWAIPAYGL